MREKKIDWKETIYLQSVFNFSWKY